MNKREPVRKKIRMMVCPYCQGRRLVSVKSYAVHLEREHDTYGMYLAEGIRKSWKGKMK